MRVKNNSNALRVIRSRDVPVSSTMAKKSKNNASQRGSSTDNLSVAEKSKMKSKATATKSEKFDKSKATAVASMQDEKKRGKGVATVTTASLADGVKNNDDTSETMTTTMEKPKKLTTHSAASNNRGGGDKKMNNKKMSKELRNLGIDFNNILTKKLSSSSTTSDDKTDKITASCGGKAQDEGSKLDESKTSICEMVKTKSRINVQSTYNRKNSDGGGASSTVVSASGSVDKDQQKIEKELLTTQAKNDDDVLGGGGGGKKNAKGLNTTKDEEKQQCSSGGDVPSKQSNKSASKSKKNLKSTNNKVDEGSSSAANKVIEPKKKKQKKNGDVPAVEGEIVTPSEPTAPDTLIPIPSSLTVGKVAKKAATPAVKKTANQVKKAAAAKKLNDNVVVANENKKKKKGKEAKSTEAFTAVPTKENAKKKKLAPKGSAEQISLSVQPPPSQPASKISVKKLSELVDCEKTKLTEEQVDDMAKEEVEAAEETKLESSYPETPENDDSIMVAADDSTEKEFVKLPTDLPSPTPSPSNSPPDVDIKEEIIEKQIEEKSHFTQSSSTTKKPTEDNESDIAAAATTTTQANKKKTTKDDRKKKEATATIKPTTAVVAHKTNDTKQSQPVAKRKYTKKNILKTIRAMTPVTTKMEDKTESVSDEAPLSTIAKALSDVKDIYDFNESGNNSDSIEVAANIGTTKLQSSTIPPIYKRKLSTKSKDDIKDEQGTEDEPKVHENSAKKSKAAAKTKSIKVEPKSSSKRASKSKASGSDETNGDDTDNSTSSSSIPLERIASKSKLAMKSRRLKYFGFWTGPKRHRMASLNALAKVQCLYENESRSAQDLGLSRPQPVFKDTKPRTPSPSTSDDGDEEKDDDEDNDHDASMKSKTKTSKAIKKKPKVEDVNVTLRSLRNAPGLRGAGKLWEMDDLSSSSDDNNDSDKTYKGDIRQAKKKKKPNPKLETQKVIPVKGLKTPKKVTPKKQPPKPIKKQPKSSASDDNKSSDESDKNEDSSSSAPLLPKNKRKRSTNDTDILANKFKNIIVSKRIASLNASAILSATYEVERHLDRDLSSSSEEVNSEEDSMDEIPSSPRKLKELKNENDNSDETKEARPVSTSVVIVQDTDVTITGVYVNSSLGSNQEAYCKMQYRVQSSVTEERVLRPTGDPPKSYTPLSALSNMRPPGAQQDGCPSVVNSHQQVPQVVPPAPPPPPPPHHHHHHPMPPTVGPPLCPSAVRCESPTLRAYQQSSTLSYQPQPQVVAPPPVHHPIPSHHPQSVSAFCAPPPSSHADNTDIRVIGKSKFYQTNKIITQWKLQFRYLQR